MGFNPDEPRAADGKWSKTIVDSLTHQLKAKGHAGPKATELAKEILQNRGLMNPNGSLTPLGQVREDMGRKARRIDRAAKQLGRHPHELGYKGGKPYVK
jgi:hypothetical protein